MYRCDIAGNATAKGEKIVAKGNGTARDGDSLVDSELFRLGRLTDDTCFIELYRLPWIIVRKYSVQLIPPLGFPAQNSEMTRS